VVEYKNHPANFQALSAELIVAVRTLNPIEQVVCEHVRLRRSGIELKGLCPFHKEKTPSFSVNSAKGVFICHGCGVGGDVFEFGRILHQCSFQKSVEILAKRAGIQLKGFEPSPELVAKVSAIRADFENELA
jgi:DNA primase